MENGREVVATSEDRNVSGAKAPWDRPGLGPWLTDPSRMALYDEIVASAIDRLGRSARDLINLREWAENNHKTLRVLAPVLVWPAPAGDLSAGIVWDLLGRLAEIERAQVISRSEAARSTIVENGGAIGKVPWGFEVVGSKYSKTIRPVPALVPVLREMIKRAGRGDSLRSIARYLSGEGIPTRTLSARGWSQVSVKNVLESECLKGRYQHGTHRMEVSPALLTSGEYTTLQGAIHKGSKGPTNADDVMIGPETIRCGHCDGAMYRIRSTTTRKDGGKNTIRYYRCKGTEQAPSTCRNQVRADVVEDWATAWFTDFGPWATVEVTRRTLVAGDDHTAEIDDLADEIRALDPMAVDFLDLATALRAEIADLQALPVTPPQIVEQATGETVGARWSRLSAADRRAYLVASGVRLTVSLLGENEAGGIDGRHTATLSGDPSKVEEAVRIEDAA